MVLLLLKNAAVPLKGKLFACYVIPESLLQLLLCSISVMIRTPLIQSPTHTHPKLKTWQHHHTSSPNTRRCFCEFLSVIFVLDQFAYFSTKKKLCWVAEAFQLKSHETKGPYLTGFTLVCAFGAHCESDAPSALNRCLVFSYLFTPNRLSVL